MMRKQPGNCITPTVEWLPVQPWVNAGSYSLPPATIPLWDKELSFLLITLAV